MSQQIRLADYRHIIKNLPPIMTLSKEQLLINELHITDLSSLKLYYAPHNEVVYSDAKLMIVSLTPGFQQMQIALAAAQEAIWEGEDDLSACYRAKQRARFAGSMRRNLIAMLDGLGIQRWLNLESCTGLFHELTTLLHSTAVIPFPAFVNGHNYSGTQPDLIKNDSIRQYALEHMIRQIRMFTNIPIIPLGRSVEKIMSILVAEGALAENQVLWGFPHPSGANGHRQKQYAEKRSCMMKQVERWKNIKADCQRD